MSKWIRKGDKVVVIAGNEKGQVGTILSRQEHHVVIAGLNIRKKHVKPKSRVEPGVVDIEMPIHISNVKLCNDKGKPIKIKVKQTKDALKQLVYLDAGKEIVHRVVKKKKD